jgi:hypothetical protein
MELLCLSEKKFTKKRDLPPCMTGQKTCTHLKVEIMTQIPKSKFNILFKK